jgi:hypothetical protein
MYTGDIIREKSNVLTWKDKIVYDTMINNHNYWITIKLLTKQDGQIFFTLNNEDIKKLIEQKYINEKKRREESDKRVNEYYLNN